MSASEDRRGGEVSPRAGDTSADVLAEPVRKQPPPRTRGDVPTVSGKAAVWAVLGLMVGVLALVVLAALFLAREENARNPPVGTRAPARSLQHNG